MKPHLDIQIAPGLRIVTPEEGSYAVIYKDKVLCCLDDYKEAVDVAKALVVAFELHVKHKHH